MDEQKRIEEIKSGLKKSVYEEAARIQVKHSDDTESTEKLSNILEGYVDKIDTIEAENLEELEEELRVLKETNVEVGEMQAKDDLVQQYNDYIHNDLDRTIAETVEYTYNLNNKTDDLNDILIRPMEGEVVDDIVVEAPSPLEPEPTPDTEELFEIEATTDLGVLEDIVELEADTLDIEGTVVASDVEIGKEEAKAEDKPVKKVKEPKEKNVKEPKEKKVKEPKEKKVKESKTVEKNSVEDDFQDEKGLAAFDYALIAILVVIFLILIVLVAKINGVF